MNSPGPERRFRGLGTGAGRRAWGNAHPVGIAVVLGLGFAIAIGIIDADPTDLSKETDNDEPMQRDAG